MSSFTRAALALVLSLSLSLSSQLASAQGTTIGNLINDITFNPNVVIISEIADKGTTGTCDGADWIELFNPTNATVDLGTQGYVMYDDQGMDSDETFSFPAGTVMEPGSYLVLCTEQTTPVTAEAGATATEVPDPMSPQFGIKGDDTIVLTRIRRANGDDSSFSVTSAARTGDIYEICSRVELPKTDNHFDVTYALVDTVKGIFNYTSTPTPNAANIISKVLSDEERNALWKQQLKEQNALGTAFFNMDDRGLPLSDGSAMDVVLDLNFTMLPEDYDYIRANKTYEMYRPFQKAVLYTVDGKEIVSIQEPGQIRSKGQSSLFLAACAGSDTFPFQVEVGEENNNVTLFGMKRFYLRHHIGDYSYMRDYAYNRMLARFGMPHVRGRKVRVTINGNLHGFYTLLEAPDQDYVFARSFPNFDPNSYALYKLKSMALDCGNFPQEQIDAAEKRLDDTSTPPYAFQRGEHKPPVEELGLFEMDQCIENYNTHYWERDFNDVVLAYLRYDRSCADMLLEEGLIDRDLGTKDYEKEMKEFIRVDFSKQQVCDEGCSNTNLADRVDVENFLKTFAFYAVTMNSDTPLINGNNYYLAQTGEEDFGGVGGWKIVPYDFNLPQVVYCHDALCNARIVHWSIARPTCTSLEENKIAGPLLADETRHAQYLEYVREFVETIYGNQSFIEELEEHAAAQEKYVKADYWSIFGSFYDKEKTPESANWEDEADRFPLLPTMKARTESVRAQLEAIDNGSFPRGPFVGVNGDNEPWEPCADWRMSEANRTACPESCEYAGCYMEGWTVPSYCDEETGKCLHGDFDESCRGLFDGERYPGMEDPEDGRQAFCRFTKGVPVKAMECPAVGAFQGTALESSASATHLAISFGVILLSFLAWV